METIYNKLNTACLFHDVNQGDEEITKMMCTIYFGFINAKYNGIIKSFTEDDIKEVAKSQHEKGLFDYKKGGYLSHGIKAVYEWLNENGHSCNLTRTKDDIAVIDWLERGYAVGLGIKVDAAKFYQDKQDGKLDKDNYEDYKGNDGHATNLIIWTSRGTFSSSSDGKEMFLDSYFTKSSTYECDINEVLEDIDMTTKYIIH